VTAAQICVTGRPDQVRALLHAIRDQRHIRLTLTRPPVRLDPHTVAVHADATCDAVCDQPTSPDPPLEEAA
jgi:hypothetical protein